VSVELQQISLRRYYCYDMIPRSHQNQSNMDILTPMLPTTKISLPLDSQARSTHLQSVNMAQNPLQMSIRAPWLELWLHMTAEISLCPHQSPLIMLYAHRALRVFDATKSIRIESWTILQVWQGNYNGSSRLRLEAQFAVPCHLENFRISIGRNLSLRKNCIHAF